MGKASTRTVNDRARPDRGGRATSAPPDHAEERDPRTVLGNRAARMLLAQPKLVVGASYDPLEVEADRVATEVVRTMANGPAAADAHDCGDDCSQHGSRTAVARTIRRHPGHAGHDATPIGAAGGDIQAADEAAVDRAHGGGVALPADFRARVEPAMGADFANVRVHTGPAATQLNRSFGASAFTVGNDIFFRDGLPDVGTHDGAHLVAHELTHTIQQGGRSAVARCSCGSTDLHVQRHSSFEHLMLGNVPPTDLAKIGAWKDAIEQTKAKNTGLTKKVKGAGGGGKKVATVDVMLGNTKVSIQKKDILHVLMQEIIRIKKWQRDVPQESSSDQANTKGQDLQNVGKDPTYDVVTIKLPQGIICTYGEMNTLGDYFGSVDVLRTAGKTQVWQLLQSVRNETLWFLNKAFYGVAESLTKQEEDDDDIRDLTDQHFNEILLPDLMDGGQIEGATAARISGLWGQVELLAKIQKTGAEGPTNSYESSLGRNACHFVPESWHAWAQNHKKARDLAAQSKAAAERSGAAQEQLQDADEFEHEGLQKTFEMEKASSSRLANEALMTNGFGDHFLQDSYAAGHMINKTQIMQFYIEFIDKNNLWDYFQDKNWRKVQNIAYGQELSPEGQYDQDQVQGYDPNNGAFTKAMDPQSVENRSGKDGSWKDNFKALGLQVPRSLSNDPTSATRQLLHEMRGLARQGKDSLKGSDIVKLMKPLGFSSAETRMAVGDMVLDGVLHTNVAVDKRGKQMASMRDKRADATSANEGPGEVLTKFLSGKYELRPELKPKKGSEPPTASEDDRQEMYAGITYGDYLEFIQSSFLQKSTNALHDTFCKHGLTVYDRGGTEIGKVYGDDAMFSANSSMGVEHSGTTSQMSRDAILNIINTGGDQGIPESAIIDRFPRQVQTDVYDGEGKVVDTAKTGIEDWHNTKNEGGLKNQAFTKIFPKMSWGLTQKLVPGAKGDLGTFFTAKVPHKPF